MGTEQRYDIYDLFLQISRAAGAAPPPAGSGGAHGPRRQRRRRRSMPTEVRAAARQLRGRRRRGGRRLLPARLPQPRARAARRAAIVRAEFPDLAVSLSSDVVAELWEYQRCVTTCANAYVQPLMDRYLANARARAARRAASAATLRLMHSAGGLVSPETARALPDPAAGDRARPAAAWPPPSSATPPASSDVISFDMGGTTAKACLIENGRAEIAPMMEAARVHRFKKGSGLPIKAPVIDMIEIGAGGGSIAVDRRGRAAARRAAFRRRRSGPGLLRRAAARSRP